MLIDPDRNLLLLATLSSLAASPALGLQQYVDERVVLAASSPTTSGPSELLTGDIDGDGWEELVARLDLSADWVMRGGPGLDPFENVELVDGSDSNGAALADLNGDGRADYLTQDFVWIGWYPGEAGATLGSFQQIQPEGSDEVFWSKAAGDLSGDGNLDVITSVGQGSAGAGAVRWFAGSGGLFGGPQSVSVSNAPADLALGDFDADGRLDVACARYDSGAAFVLFGQSAGLSVPRPVAPAGAEARFVEAGDLDADGIADLACLPYGPSLTWFRGGAGGLSLGGSLALPGATGATRDLDARDIDLDGAADLLAVESVGGDGRLHRMMGQAAVGPVAAVVVHALPSWSAAVFEYDGQPGLDLAYLPLSWKHPALRPGDGQGGFLAPLELTVGGPCADSDPFCAADIDRDGAIDLAFETGVWLRGDGQGSFLPEASLGARPSELADLDGDGWLDAIGLVPGCAPGSGLVVSLGSSHGFGPEVAPPQPSGALVAFALGDLDADGDLDVASAGSSGAYAHLFSGGTFAPYLTTTLPTGCENIGAGDLNGDGLADLALTTYVFSGPFGQAEARLAWGLSTGAGQVAAVQSAKLFTSTAGQLLVDDVDGDALADIVWVRTQFGQVVAALGDGAGNLGTATPLVTLSGAGGLSLALADVDGDGARDLVWGSGASSTASARVGIARWTVTGYELWREIGAPAGAGKIVPADLDADGQLDLLWGNGATVRVARNLRADPAGTAPFGTGTSGCLGRVSIGAVQPAQVANPTFRLLAHNLPPGGFGWIALGTASSVAGTDPFGLGAVLHVDPLASSTVQIHVAPADAGGQADLALPIPAKPQLAGLTLTAQALHFGTLGQDCSASPLALVSSRGLAIAIQP